MNIVRYSKKPTFLKVIKRIQRETDLTLFCMSLELQIELKQDGII